MGGTILLTVAGCALLLRSQEDLPIFWPDYVVRIFFPFLFSQLALGFMLALFGLFDWCRGGDPHHILRRKNAQPETSIPLAATAIVIPVYNEEVERVSRGIINMWESLEKTGQLESFDFYLCSDSNDPNYWVKEECAWLQLCQKLQGFGKLFYRKRHHAINGKSGNVADFCRRWGKNYRYMILLDADSVMSGPTMVRMVRTMEANLRLGILQTQPAMVLGESLFRRMLQFSQAIYGRLFSQGSSMVLMSSNSYWGHNAIIRVAPFIEHCALPSVPAASGKSHILSHDTIEAILMQRAGYEVWVMDEGGGSYEEGPPNLSDMLQRDRRWCAGNLQHFWFLWARGIPVSNRLGIWLGLMSYLSSPIWLLLFLAGCVAAAERQRFLSYAAGPEALGAVHHLDFLYLFLFTLVLLFAPRVLGLISALPQAKQYGGFFRLLVSALFETLFSMLLAPVLMLFHTLFVGQIFLGWRVRWTTQNRTDLGLPLSHCLKLYGWQSALGIIGLTLGEYSLGSTVWWLTPIFVPWIVAPFLAWVTSFRRLGLALRRAGGFLTREETHHPAELQRLLNDPANSPTPTQTPLWTQALFHSYFLGLHLSLMRQKISTSSDENSDSPLAVLRERLVKEGPDSLNPSEKIRIFWDADTVAWLHRELWCRAERDRHPSWQHSQKESCLSRWML